MSDLQSTEPPIHGTYKSYIIGFVISLILTLTSFFLVIERMIDGWALIYIICTLGFIQAIIQLLFFLHMGQEEKPHWDVLVFSFMVLVVLIVVVGSIWIMDNLDYRMMGKVIYD